MFCPNCGTQNAESAQTCSKCAFQLKGGGQPAAPPKFKGTMLMMNQPGQVPGAPPRPGSAPQVDQPASGPAPSFQAEAPPMGAGAPSAGAAPAPNPVRLKGTMVGVAPPSAAVGAPPPDQQVFGAPGGGGQPVNALAGTMALDAGALPNFGQTPGYDPNAGLAGQPGQPGQGGFGAPPPQQDFGAPPQQGFGGAPPAGPGGGPDYGAQGGYGGAPPPGGAGAGGAGYGQPQGGYGGAPPQQGQDFGQQMNQGFNQMGQAFNQAGQQMDQAFNPGGMQQYPPQGGMMQPGQPGMMGMPGEGKPWMITLILCLLSTIGFCGIHRFYVGKIGSGIAQFLTFGGCGLWQLYDLVMIITGKFTDAQGRPLVKQ